MSRGRLAIVGCVLLAAVAAQAGEIKVHNWPVQYRYVPQEVTTIGVVMDVGFWIEIINQDDVIKLEQVSIQKYEGCLDLQVKCNFNLTFTCEIVPTGTIPGTYSCAFLNSDIDAPGGVTTLCARLEDANIGSVPGGSVDVHVASIVVSVVPR